jgi:hypothetical protein
VEAFLALSTAEYRILVVASIATTTIVAASAHYSWTTTVAVVIIASFAPFSIKAIMTIRPLIAHAALVNSFEATFACL